MPCLPFPSPKVCPWCSHNPKRRLDPASRTGTGLGHAWSCGTEQRSCVLWEYLPVQVVGAVPCNDSYWHIKDFIVFELEENNVCEWGWERPCKPK